MGPEANALRSAVRISLRVFLTVHSYLSSSSTEHSSLSLSDQ